MSTRGIYKIGGYTLYNHHDNYPEGAALHLLGVLKNHHSLRIESVIRGMERVEIVESGGMGEEYEYRIDKKGNISMYEVDLDTDKAIFLEVFTIPEFIAKYITKEGRQYNVLDESDNIEDYRIIQIRGRYWTITQVREMAREQFADAVSRFKKGHWGNSSSSFSEAFKYFNILGEGEQEKAEYLENIAPVFQTQYGHETPEHFISYTNENF